MTLMSELDDLIASNVAKLRLSAGVLQTELAQRMRAKGHKWTQPTVVAVEKGERPLRLAEATDLADILDAELDWLLRYPPSRAFFFGRESVVEALEALTLAGDRFEAYAARLVEFAELYEEETNGSMQGELDEVLVIRDAQPLTMKNAIHALSRVAERRGREGYNSGERQAEE